MIGTGPYTLTAFTTNGIAFSRNPSYWGPKPHIDAFGLQIYSDDDAMITALKNGELDAVEGIPTGDARLSVIGGASIDFWPGWTGQGRRRLKM